MQTIVRKGSFDSGHRVMRESVKCKNLHGHTYLYELVFEFDSMKEIGYAIDFKEIKRVGCQFIDDYFDHAFIINPQDKEVIDLCKSLNSKYWLMSLLVNDFCNPTVENIAKELFLCISYLFAPYYPSLTLKQIILYETPNCYTVCTNESISHVEEASFLGVRGELIQQYIDSKGIKEYDEKFIKK